MAERKPREERIRKEKPKKFDREIVAVIATAIALFVATAALMLSFKAESRDDWNRAREDWARTEQKIEVMRQEAKEFREMWAKESKEFNEKWAQESREFHGRLIEIEQSRKNNN